MKLDLPPFTLIRRHHAPGMLTNPLRDRFGIVARWSSTATKSCRAHRARSSNLLNVNMDSAGALEIARRSRGTPRIANRLLRRVRDFAEVRSRRRGTSPARWRMRRCRCWTWTPAGST